MMRWLRLLLATPLLLLLGLFAGSNRAPITLLLWPTDFSLTVPLSVAVLGAAGMAFFTGGFAVWISAFRQRRTLRRMEDTVRLLEDRLRALRDRVVPANSVLPPPPREAPHAS